MADALRDVRAGGGDPRRQHRGAGPGKPPGPGESQGCPAAHPPPRRGARGLHAGDRVLGRRDGRLLPRLLKGRTRGPVFTTHRKPGPGKVVSARDVCPDTGLARLSYGQARMLLDQHTALGGESGTGWDLHEWRHSGLTHLGEAGASLLMLMAKSRHKKPENARRYFHPSPEAIAEVTSLLAPATADAELWSVAGQAPKRGDFRSAGGVEGIGGVLCSWMPWSGVRPVQDLQTCCLNGGQQLAACPKSEALGQVRQDEPSFASRFEVGTKSVEEAVKHVAVRVVDALLDRRGGPGGDPGRVADDEVRAPVGEEAGAHDVDTSGEAQSVDVLACAGQCAGADVGGHDVVDPRWARTAASTPVPVPRSNAARLSADAGRGAWATKSTYSPLTGENTP